jgi:uncharacterized membrane protein YcaP (DUF421 family)
MMQSLVAGSAAETAVRALVIFAFTLALVRLGRRRAMGRGSAFDFVISIMLGSVMSRGIDGATPLLPTLVAGSVLLGLHWLLAVIAFHTDWFGPLIKGGRTLLIKDGKMQTEAMRRVSVTPHDLEQAIREQTNQTDPGKIRLAYLERDGGISFIAQKEEPRVITISVEKGVQTVRIEL